VQIHLDLDSSFFKDYRQLLDLCFSSKVDHSYLEDFPIWDPQFQTARLIRTGITFDGHLIATASVRLADLQIADHSSVPIAIIGAVATHTNWRRQGLATHLTTLILKWVEDQDVALTLLWSDQLNFYQKFGFQPIGEQIFLPLEAALPSVLSLSVPQLHTNWHPDIFNLVQQRPLGLKIQNSDYSWYEAHRHVRWFYSSQSHNNQPTAYAALGRGIDLDHLIHEWGGHPQHLTILLQHIQTIDPQALLLGQREYLNQLGFSTQHGLQAPLCLARWCKSYLNHQNPSSLTQFEKNLWIWGLDAA
jgi:GNAT superfamily N-acetyltransferase